VRQHTQQLSGRNNLADFFSSTTRDAHELNTRANPLWNLFGPVDFRFFSKVLSFLNRPRDVDPADELLTRDMLNLVAREDGESGHGLARDPDGFNSQLMSLLNAREPGPVDTLHARNIFDSFKRLMSGGYIFGLRDVDPEQLGARDDADMDKFIHTLLNAREPGSDDTLHARGIFSSLISILLSGQGPFGLRDVSSEPLDARGAEEDLVRKLLNSREIDGDRALHARGLFSLFKTALGVVSALSGMAGLSSIQLRDASSPGLTISADDLVKALLQK
jgi:hypothetical protein